MMTAGNALITSSKTRYARNNMPRMHAAAQMMRIDRPDTAKNMLTPPISS